MVSEEIAGTNLEFDMVYVGWVCAWHVQKMVCGEKWGGWGLGGLLGGEKNRHTQMVSRQPKKREEDEHAKSKVETVV
jgi:hypothetical protein